MKYILLLILGASVGGVYYVCNTLLRMLLVSVIGAMLWWLFLSPSDINEKEYRRWLNKRNLITERYAKSKWNNEKYDVIFIGSGTAALHCAAVLSRLGYKVLLLEQHYVAGGGTHEYELTEKDSKRKYVFDSGLHYAIPLSEPITHLVCGTKKAPVPWLRLGSDQRDGCYDWIVLGDAMKERSDFFRIRHDEKHLPDIYKLFPTEQDKKDIDSIMSEMGTAMKLFPFWVLQRFLPLRWQHLYRKYVLNKWLNFVRYAGRTHREVVDALTKNDKLKSLVSGLWLDTGTNILTCSFMLSSSVFRGFPHEGGAYPKGGSTAIAKSLTAIIKMHGGNVLVRAKVANMLVSYNGKTPRIKGVEMENGDHILCNHVISSAGYNNTFSKLLTEYDQQRLHVEHPTVPDLECTWPFLMCNIGIRGNYKELDIADTNLWYLPVNEKNNWNVFKAVEDFVNCENPKTDAFDPDKNIDFCCGFTWPSIKAKDDDMESSEYTTCQILLMTPWPWFERWYKNGAFKSGDAKNADQDYHALKKLFLDACLEKLYRYYPTCKGKVDFTDVSSPLSLEYYLKSDKGGACGLECTPSRFVNDDILDLTDCDKNHVCQGLWITGQDFLICGVPICQAAGMITAFRFVGFKKTAYFMIKCLRTFARSLL